MKKLSTLLVYAAAVALCFAANPTFTIDATQSAGKVSPILYGLMTEEINHSYDGGLYAELIQNRAFLDNRTMPVHWSAVTNNGTEVIIALDPEDTNSITEPRKVLPITSRVRGVKPSFACKLPPHSIMILKLKARS